jgi:prevent-host-death family protein
VKKTTMHDAKTNLSKLVRYAEAGEEVLILRGKKPVARLVAVSEPGPRKPGRYKGQIHLPKSFFDPLPPEEMRGLL